jgi:hypothetical protein
MRGRSVRRVCSVLCAIAEPGSPSIRNRADPKSRIEPVPIVHARESAHGSQTFLEIITPRSPTANAHPSPRLLTFSCLSPKAAGIVNHCRRIGTPRPTRSRVTIAGGRSPGSRVAVSVHLPRNLHSQWLSRTETRRLQLRGQPRHCVRVARAPRSLLIPCGNHQGRASHWNADRVNRLRGRL